MTNPSDTPDQPSPLERLKIEAERWIPYVSALGEGDAYGNASRGLRDVVQRAYDLGKASPSAVPTSHGSAAVTPTIATVQAQPIRECPDGKTCTNLPTGQCWGQCVRASIALSRGEAFYKVTGPVHVVCQCDKCKASPSASGDSK